jgi:hypothetical protein
MVGDCLLSALVGLIDLALFVTGTVTHDPNIRPWYVAIPLDIAMVAPLAYRRKYPLIVG